MTWRTSRSEIITAQHCPRKAWYSRFFGGTGISRKRSNLPLVFGSAFHAGAEALLAGDVETAVAKARLYLQLAFSNEAIDIEESEVVYALGEQIAIAEGLLRGWWAQDGERFLRDFEVLEVEREGEAELAPGVVLQFRPDALVRERQSGDLYIVSWKTTSIAGAWTVNQALVDMQSMSEVWGTLNNDSTALAEKLNVFGFQIEGVLYLNCVKGQRKKDDYTGTYKQNSPLAYCWKRSGPTSEDDEYAWKYGWDTEEINAKTGKAVGTKLGKGYRLVPVWTDYPGGVKAWIADLAAQRIAPRHINALAAAFPQSLPVSRREDEIESWRRQVVAQEQAIQERLGKVEFVQETGAPIDHALDRQFPQHTHSCFLYNSKCQFFDCCWNPAVKADPMASGLYQIASRNHPIRETEDD